MGAPKLYLAGPEVFLDGAQEIGRRKQALCTEHGFIGLYPLDHEVAQTAGERRDRLIYRANVAMIRDADAGIFNLSPFRGPSADPGTVFELGVMIGLGKPCFGYTNDALTLLERMEEQGDAIQDPATGSWVDLVGQHIENFENSDNLMIDAALAEQGEGFFVRPLIGTILPLDDLAGFEACRMRAARHFGLPRSGRP